MAWTGAGETGAALKGMGCSCVGAQFCPGDLMFVLLVGSSSWRLRA